MKEKDIKTRQSYRPPKPKAGKILRPRGFMQRSLLRAGRQTKQTASRERPPEENSSQYAENRVEQGAKNTVRSAAYRGKRMIGRAIRQRDGRRHTAPIVADRPVNPAQQRYRVQTIRGWQASRVRRAAEEMHSHQALRQGADMLQNTLRPQYFQQQAVRQSAVAMKAGQRGTKAAGAAIKTGAKGVKAAGRAVKTSAYTAKAATKVTVRTAQTAAKGSARVAQALKTAARATATASKAMAKAAAAMAKAVAAAIKALVAAIAAGGGVALIVILVVAVIALILGSAFGIFFSDQADPGKLKQAIVDINTQFTADLQARVDSLSSGGYDSVIVSYDGDYDGDGPMVNNWQDVLAVFATKNMYDGDELLTFDDKKARALGVVFNHMNEADIQTRVETSSSTTMVDGEEVTVTTSTLYINIRILSMTYLEGAALYRFDKEKIAMLEELMSEDYNELWADLLDVDIYGGLSFAELTQITDNLPTGTKGGAIAQAALSKVGTAYSAMDCSQLTGYAYAQAGVSLPRTSVAQAKYCYDNGYGISQSQLQPGDLVFWSKSCSCGRWNEIHHTGVYIGNGKIVDASSTKGRVVVRNLWDSASWQTVLFARPHV